ncbi:MAG TPA: MarR family transcriptional regulator [Candidatus Limnocylindrales bacterium]
MASDLDLDKQVCFALYSASRSLTALYRPLLERLGLTYPQYLAMLVLWERGDTSVKRLGRALMLDSGTLSPLLKRLESAGLVTRRRDPGDERSVVIALTDAGRALKQRASSIPRTIAKATGVPSRDLVQLRDTLRSITAAAVPPKG